MNRIWKRYRELLKGRDKGTVAITFLVSLPILLLVIGIIAQYALLVNARLTVERAAASAARTAMTALPTDPDIDEMDGDNFVNRSARLALEPISSDDAIGSSTEAQQVGAALRNLGVNIPASFETRYTHAENSTTVDWVRLDANDVPIADPAPWEPGDFARARGQRIKLTLHYRYYMNVPVIRNLIGRHDDVLNRNYVLFNASEIVQLSPGRMAVTDGNGWPQ